MKQIFLYILLFLTFSAEASTNPSELAVEFFIDSLFDADDIDYHIANSEFLFYAKKNYKGFDNVKEFMDYSTKKIKCREKEYTKNLTKEFREFNRLAYSAYKHLDDLESRLYSIILKNKSAKTPEFINTLFITTHQINYWSLNCYKPKELGVILSKLYSATDNFDLVEKLCLFILAAKIYKASHYVNPMHICVSTYAKIEISLDLDSLNLNTESITIDSLPNGTKPPMFVGGYMTLSKYINDNLKYPEKALEVGDKGRVLASFKVDESGHVFNTKIKESPSDLLSKEVIRLVESFPRWIPDPQTKKGAGFTKFTLPIIFKLPIE